ncbi:hypothetical protein MUP77_01800 [Candidatus Bathyarchaeota archaeon]|nr:hypothetical protein [Candidatus Bathyarchaeota archaeon]
MHPIYLAHLLYLGPSMLWRTVIKKPLTPDALRQLQNQKLSALITHSYAHVPYYRHLFQKNGLHPDDIQTVDDLPKIPVTRKTDLRDLPVEDILASDYTVDQCKVDRTSGTTGIPLTIYRDRKAELMGLLAIVRWQLECGDAITHKTIDLGSGTGLPTNHPFQKVGIFRKKWVSPFIDVKTQIEEIKTYDPRTLVSYPTLLEELAKEIIEKDVRGLDIQLVFSMGENLDDPTRTLIHNALDAEVFNIYGTREVSRVSAECAQHQGLHIFAESNLVEITHEGEPVQIGEEGEVMITNLYNHAMPFIRYATEDIGMLLGSECPCGNCAPLMQITEGRTKDRIWLPNGRMVSAAIPIEVLRYIEGLRQFQLVQEAYDRFLVHIIPGRKMAKTALDAIREQLTPILGDVTITVEEVDHIPRERSGKLLQFISHVQTA